MIENLIEPVLVCAEWQRENSARYMARKMPEIMFRKNFNFEPLLWICPVCNVENRLRHHVLSTLDYQPVITPRIFRCHNSRCHVKRMYYRLNNNELWARYIGKYEDVNELDFVSRFDPIKFYTNLNPHINVNQTKLF